MSPGPPGISIRVIPLAPAAGQEALLSRDESARAARFRTPLLRERFVAAHAGLRLALAEATGQDPAGLQFVAGKGGKPQLADRAVSFNLSHSGALAVVAIAASGDVGVDIEVVRPVTDLDALARTCLTPGEQTRVRTTPAADRDRAFLTVWTIKEAWLKADGAGLGRPMEELEVRDVDGAPRVFTAEDPTGARFAVAPLALGADCGGYVAAVATTGAAPIVCRRWCWDR